MNSHLQPIPSRWFNGHVWRPIVTGVLAAQIIAMVLLWNSNQRVIEKAWLIEASGYLSVPTFRVASSLSQMGSIACGGLFFSLTLGVLLSLLTVLWKSIWKGFPRFRIGILALGGGFWFACLWGINANGFSVLPAIFFAAVPLSILILASFSPPKELNVSKTGFNLPFVAPLIILSGVLIFSYEHSVFVRFRDAVLLDSPLGEAINRFYYRYTLMAAEAIKPIHQKSVKTFRWNGEWPEEIKNEMKIILIKKDYLPVPDDPSPDIIVSVDPSGVTLKDYYGKSETISHEEFKSAPSRYLDAFSIQSDQFTFFRRALLISLLIGFPFLVYMLCYECLFCLSQIFLDKNYAAVTAGALCLAMGLGVFAAVNFHDTAPLKLDDLPALSRSSEVPIRIKTAQALAHSTSNEAGEVLREMMMDSQVNVSCMAIWALGSRRDRAYIETLRDFLLNQADWYRQWYAYQALRKLGWRQQPSR